MVEIFLEVLFYFSLKAADSFLSSFFAGSLLFLLGITLLVLFLFLSEVKILCIFIVEEFIFYQVLR